MPGNLILMVRKVYKVVKRVFFKRKRVSFKRLKMLFRGRLWGPVRQLSWNPESWPEGHRWWQYWRCLQVLLMANQGNIVRGKVTFQLPAKILMETLCLTRTTTALKWRIRGRFWIIQNLLGVGWCWTLYRRTLIGMEWATLVTTVNWWDQF